MRIRITDIKEKYKAKIISYFNTHRKSLMISFGIALASLLLPTIPYINLIFPEKFTGAIVLFSILMIISQRVLAFLFSLILFIGILIILVDPASTEVLGYALFIIIVASILKSLLENNKYKD